MLSSDNANCFKRLVSIILYSQWLRQSVSHGVPSMLHVKTASLCVTTHFVNNLICLQYAGLTW